MSVVPAQRVALDALADDGWTVLRRLSWPGRLQQPVDLLLVGPGGVLVVDVLRAGRRPSDRECLAAAQAGVAVATLLHAEHQDAVRALLCLTGSAVPVSEVAPGVLVVSDADLHRWVSELPARLDDDEVRHLAAHLCWQLGGQPAVAQPTPATPTSPSVDEVPATRRALREAERLAQRRRPLRALRAGGHSQPTPSPSLSSERL